MIEQLINLLPSALDEIKYVKETKEKTKEVQRKKQQEKIEAISKIKSAVIATKAYIYDSRELGNSSREEEKKLSEKWIIASKAIWTYDRILFDIADVKASGWADPNEWKKLKNKVSTVNLDKIIEQCEYHITNIK